MNVHKMGSSREIEVSNRHHGIGTRGKIISLLATG